MARFSQIRNWKKNCTGSIFDIRKNGVKVPDDPYVIDEETDARMELNQVISELERIADFAKEPDIRQYLFEIKAELEIEGITAE
ncbi:hypothetical protein EFAU085_01891 [Enterococcus faecium Aus0085]|nr:hypothetical protein EFAU085_01891 [Enterococcus faecium Aus0085]